MAFDTGLADRVRSLLAAHPGITERKMFGGLAFLLHGHMCCGILKTDLMLRLPPEAVTKALRKPHTRPMDFTGKPMKGMMFVEAMGTDLDEDLEAWVASAVAFVRTMPPK
jgi:hypothetical protein